MLTTLAVVTCIQNNLYNHTQDDHDGDRAGRDLNDSPHAMRPCTHGASCVGGPVGAENDDGASDHQPLAAGLEQLPLPDGWTALMDPGSGATYYYFAPTEETRWERPQDPAREYGVAEGKHEAGDGRDDGHDVDDGHDDDDGHDEWDNRDRRDVREYIFLQCAHG